MSRSCKGFTLIELLVAMAIAGILAAVAVASYQEHIATSKRAAAKGVLVEAANWLERQYSALGCYRGVDQNACPANNAAIVLPDTLIRSPREGSSKSYLVAAVSNDANAQSYTLTATPCGSANCVNAGLGYTDDEFADGKCDVLSINSLGTKGESGSASVDDCWNR